MLNGPWKAPLFIMATGCSCLDMISSFLFSLEMKPKIAGHVRGYSYMLHFGLRPTFLGEWFNIYITSFLPKTMNFFMLGSTDNTVSITQIRQGIRCQEALFTREDIWIQDVYPASEEVQREQEIALSYSLHFCCTKCSEALKMSACVSQNWLSAMWYLLKSRDKSI